MAAQEDSSAAAAAVAASLPSAPTSLAPKPATNGSRDHLIDTSQRLADARSAGAASRLAAEGTGKLADANSRQPVAGAATAQSNGTHEAQAAEEEEEGARSRVTKVASALGLPCCARGLRLPPTSIRTQSNGAPAIHNTAIPLGALRVYSLIAEPLWYQCRPA